MSIALSNLILFFITVVGYFFLLSVSCPAKSKRQIAARLCILALLSAPFNIGGNIFTVLGNALSEKSVYSVTSVFQDAKKGDAITLFSPFGFQYAEKGSALTLFGVVADQRAGVESVLGVGIVVFQKSSKKALVPFGIVGLQDARNAFVALGIVGRQKASESAGLGVGIVGFQRANKAMVVLGGVVGWQDATEKSVTVLGIVGSQRAKEVTTIVGLVGFQDAVDEANYPVAIAFYQRVGNVRKSFAFLSKTKAYEGK